MLVDDPLIMAGSASPRITSSADAGAGRRRTTRRRGVIAFFFPARPASRVLRASLAHALSRISARDSPHLSHDGCGGADMSGTGGRCDGGWGDVKARMAERRAGDGCCVSQSCRCSRRRSTSCPRARAWCTSRSGTVLQRLRGVSGVRRRRAVNLTMPTHAARSRPRWSATGASTTSMRCPLLADERMSRGQSDGINGPG